jgi:hypothetical protein
MPLARDFFETFETLPISSHPWVLREGLYYHLKYILHVDPHAYLLSSIDIEEFHSALLEHLISSSSAQRSMLWKAYNELVFMFAFCLNVIQNGPPSRAHIELAKRLTSKDVIITFNWDTLMDRALSTIGQWAIDNDYALMPRSIFRDSWLQPSSSPSEHAGPTLLKLHGSTNWLVGHPIEEDGKLVLTQATPSDTLYAFERATKPYDTYAGRFMEGFAPYSYGYYPPNIKDIGCKVRDGHVLVMARLKVPWKPEGTAGDQGLVSMPLIIPPVKDKNYDLYGGLFRGLWARACDALSEAEEIIIIGYSFPRTDHKSHELFASAFGRRTGMPHVTIVDPAPGRAVDKMRMDFGISDANLTIVSEPFSSETMVECIVPHQ